MEKFQGFIYYIEDFNSVSIVIRLVLATIFGGIIGIEREAKRHSAGFRTFTLVCLGSALCTIVNLYLWKITGSADVSRIPAGVVSGIGFLGVGTIVITRKNSVRGLTTAAGLWTTATLGMALGAGMICVSSFAFILVIVTIGVMRKLSEMVVSTARVFSVYIEFLEEDNLDDFLSFVQKNNYTIYTMERRKEKISKKCAMGIMIELDIKKKASHEEVIKHMQEIKGVHYIEEVRG